MNRIHCLPLVDIPNTCEGCCWELGGASELVGCLGSFFHFQLSHELEFHRLHIIFANMFSKSIGILASIHSIVFRAQVFNWRLIPFLWPFFLLRHIFCLLRVLCADCTFRGKSGARNKGKNIRGNSGRHQQISKKNVVVK